MNLEQNEQKDLIETTDYLEVIGVFRCWKNFLFVVLIFFLLLSQISFWLVNTNCIPTEQTALDKAAVVAANELEQPAGTVETEENIKKAAEQIVAEPNKPAESMPRQLQSRLAKFHFKVEFKHLAWFINLVNFVLVFAAILYCLTMLFSIKISLLGRLGGINHISRAFFLSLVFLVLLLPWQIFWQKIFAGELFGAIYTPSNLLSSFTTYKDSGILYKVFYYLRFCAYWFFAVLLLILSQLRSVRWSKTVLRRLEVI